jgi:hypothetical protein
MIMSKMDACPKCGAPMAAGNASLHVWIVEFDCGASISGVIGIDEVSYIFDTLCGHSEISLQERINKEINLDKKLLSQAKLDLIENINLKICDLTVLELADIVKYLEKETELDK